MTGDDRLLAWLAHRGAIRRLDAMPLPAFHFNLEGNRGTQAFLEHYGKRTIKGIVGFVDVVGFSTSVKGRSPEGIAEFLEPFLLGVCGIVTKNRGLVDKMIGDEIMFIVPELLEDGGGPAPLSMGLLLAELLTLQRRLGDAYRMRAGLAYGSLFISHLQAGSYSEWSIVGEPVHLAKRLMTDEVQVNPVSIACAVGALMAEMAPPRFANLLGDVAGTVWQISDQGTREDFKGVSAAHYAFLSPRELKGGVC